MCCNVYKWRLFYGEPLCLLPATVKHNRAEKENRFVKSFISGNKRTFAQFIDESPAEELGISRGGGSARVFYCTQ